MVVCLFAAACSSDGAAPTPNPSTSTSPGTTPTSTPTSSPTATPTVTPTAVATKIVYGLDGDLWLYTVANDSLRRLTKTSAFEYLPKFIDANRISYLTYDEPESSIYELRLSNGATRRMFRTEAGRIDAYQWSPGRTTVAAWLADHTGSKHELHLIVTARNSDKKVRQFGAFPGREGIEDDEVDVRWAPDGRAVLVVATPLESTQRMFVVRGTGANVISPRNGTFARYSPDGKRIIYREFAGQHRWFSVTVPGNVTTVLNAGTNTYRGQLSLDGSLLTYDNGKERPSVYAYTFSTRSQRRVGGGIQAIWFGPNTIAVRNTVRCVEGPDPCFTPYTTTGTVNRISLTDGSSKRLKLKTTDGDVLYQ